MRRLEFADPDPRALIAAAATKGVRTLRIVGSGALAKRLAEGAGKGVTVVRTRHAGAAPVDPVAEAVVFAETDGEKLRRELARCIAWPRGRIVAPITAGHFSRKPLFLVSIPKAGTHLLYELARALGYAEGVDLPDFPEPQTWYCVDYSNSHTRAPDFFVDTVRRAPFGARHHPFMGSPTLFMYRHPLDILVSEAHYYHQDGNAAFAGWLEGRGFEARVERLMGDPWLLGPLRERLGVFLPWLDFPNVASLSFEEMVGESGGGRQDEQLDALWSILLKLQAPGDPALLAGRLFNPKSATFRSGQIGGFAQALSRDTITRFAAEGGDVLQAFGYPADGAMALPVQRAARRERPLKLSKVDFAETAILVEAGYLGCNLVRFRGRMRAVPQSAGPLALDRLKPEQLDALPSATSLAELKGLLLLGPPTLAERIESYDLLGQSLAANPAERGVPKVVGDHQGFNLVAYAGHIFGLRQAAGAIDLSGGLAEIASRYPTGDVLIGRSGAEVRDEIDGFSTAVRAWREASQARSAAVADLAVLRAEVDALAKRLQSEQTTAHAALAERLADVAAALAEAEGRQTAAQSALDARQAAALTDAEARQSHATDALGGRLSAAEARQAAAVEALDERLLSAEARQASTTEALGQRLDSAEARQAATTEALGQRLDSADTRQAATTEALGQRLESAEARQAAAAEDLGQRLESAEARQAAAAEDLGQRLVSAEARQAAAAEGLGQRLVSAEARQAAAAEGLGQRLESAEARQAAAADAFDRRLAEAEAVQVATAITFDERLAVAVADQERIRADLAAQAAQASAAEDRLSDLLADQARSAAAEVARLDAVAARAVAALADAGGEISQLRDALGDLRANSDDRLADLESDSRAVSGRLAMLEDPARDQGLIEALNSAALRITALEDPAPAQALREALAEARVRLEALEDPARDAPFRDALADLDARLEAGSERADARAAAAEADTRELATQLVQRSDDLAAQLARRSGELAAQLARLTSEQAERTDSVEAALAALDRRGVEWRNGADRRLAALAETDEALSLRIEANREATDDLRKSAKALNARADANRDATRRVREQAAALADRAGGLETAAAELRDALHAARASAETAFTEAAAALAREADARRSAVRRETQARTTAIEREAAARARATADEADARTAGLTALAAELDHQAAELSAQLLRLGASVDAGVEQNLAVTRTLEALAASHRAEIADELGRLRAAWREAHLRADAMQAQLTRLEATWAARLDRGLRRLIPGRTEEPERLH